MRRNGVVLSRENAERMQHVRAEIGRRLRELYDVGGPPMPERLADLIREIERPDTLCEESWPMSKPDEYRANARECERMAAGNPNEKASLLQMAQRWLAMIPKVGPVEPDHSGAAVDALARQTRSEESY